MIFFSTSTIKIFLNVYIFVLIFGNTISIPHKNKQNVVNIVGIQPSMKTNTKNTKTSNKTSKKTKLNQDSPE
jgi:hypothetical protein